MRPKYDGVKFYGVHDWDIKNNLDRAMRVLDSFDLKKEYTNANEVVELYNIQKLIDSDIVPDDWDAERTNQYRKTCNSFMRVLGKFFGKIGDKNFREICDLICIEYVNDFLNLFVKYKSYNNVSGATFTDFLNSTDIPLYMLLQFGELCKFYDKELTEVLRVSTQTPRLIIDKFLRKQDYKYSYGFPKGFFPSEYENILQKYVKLDTANFNDLQLLAHARSSKDCPISDKLRLSAKKVAGTYWEKHPFTGVTVGYGMGIKFADIDKIEVTENCGNNTFQITYDIKWILDNLDYPTILNNFIYVFRYFDDFGRSTLVSIESKLDVFERAFSTNGINEYIKGNYFNRNENLSTMQMKGYYDILKDNGIRLEDVIKWFFEEYLQEEFGAKGFRFNPPSEGTTLVEKCKTIATEMDGILKQFRMYTEDGEIDRELFEMSSEHIVFSQLPGLISRKYVYVNSNDVQRQQYLLFSDQTLLGYTEKTGDRYSRLIELLSCENVRLSDFEEYQKVQIQWLVEHDVVLENPDGYLKLNIPKVYILKDLYDNDVICLQYYGGELEKMVDDLCESEDLKLSGGLFSKPEQDYLNYLLNKSVYSNGLDLRNKYTHSTYPEDEKTQLRDYIVLLKVMILVVVKINEEFCLKEEMNENR